MDVVIAGIVIGVVTGALVALVRRTAGKPRPPVFRPPTGDIPDTLPTADLPGHGSSDSPAAFGGLDLD